MPPKFYVKGEIFQIFQVSYPENSLAILVMNEENYQIFPEKSSWFNIKNYETEKFGENG